jgi:hypothetical protein
MKTAGIIVNLTSSFVLFIPLLFHNLTGWRQFAASIVVNAVITHLLHELLRRAVKASVDKEHKAVSQVDSAPVSGGTRA